MPPEADRGAAAEATLWGVVGRLRARGWYISLREIQRAQDVLAFLFATLARPPSDDELRRYLRPIFCARDVELEAFAEAFRESAPASAAESDDGSGDAAKSWRNRIPLLIVAAVAVLALGAAFVPWDSVTGPGTNNDSGGSVADGDSRRTMWMWSVLLGFVVASAGTALLAVRKRLRRRPGSPAPGPDVQLGWDATHPLDPTDCAQVARVLRTRIREPGRNALDVTRTVDASIRAGIRLTPRFVEYKRAPEYLAVIEQHSAGDVLAGHYARVVDQLAVQGVAMSRVGLQARSQLVIDPARGPRHLDTLHPTSERERLLLFAPDRSLRDPLTGAPRPWLARLDRWAETIQIDPDARHVRPPGAVHRVLDDVRALDPEWAREQIRSDPAGPALPTIFEEGDQAWIEVMPPRREDLEPAMGLLVTALGPSGWYWLAACAVYPEISYELTLALGRLLHADDGRPLADHLPLEVLARLPWFRHAYMPDWLRATLIVTLSRGQLNAVRAAVHQILASGLLAKAGSKVELSVTESGPRTGPDAATTDRVHLDGTALRRRQLAAAAPKSLVAALRRQRHRFAMSGLPADAPSPRVRRALVMSNGLMVAATLVSTIAIAVLVAQAIASPDPDALHDSWGFGGFWPGVAFFSLLTSFTAAVFSCAVSAAAGRRRGVALGAGLLILSLAPVSLLDGGFQLLPSDAAEVILVFHPVLALAWLLAMLRRDFRSTTTLWTRFQRRNRVVFAVGLGVACLGMLLPASSLVTLAGLGVGLGAAYAGGVRVLPLAAGAALVLAAPIGFYVGNIIYSVLLVASTVAVLAGFTAQMWRFRKQPPPEFWETRWADWKRPLGIATPGVVGAVAFVLSGGDVAVTAWWIGVAVVLAGIGLVTDRVSAFVARHRLGVRSPLHLD